MSSAVPSVSSWPVSPWQSTPANIRCRRIANVAGVIAERSETLLKISRAPWRTDDIETLTGELFPLCAALKWIGRRGPKCLRDQRFGASGRPAWLWGVRSRVRRVPLGQVLILATWNYPLFLPGVQVAQALAAGNTVLLKPAPGCEAITEQLADAFYHAGVPSQALQTLHSSSATASQAIRDGVDMVVLTGAASTGQTVMNLLAETVTPSIMELSGCDAMIVHPEADLKRVADAIVFGMTFNSGATCIAPRRIIAEHDTMDSLISTLKSQWSSTSRIAVHPAAAPETIRHIESALRAGASDVLGHFFAESILREHSMPPTILDGIQADAPIANADIFAPVTSLIRVDDITQSVDVVNRCRYRLTASLFGPTGETLSRLAESLHVGSVTINDLIVPTADPRLPFGGRGRSGFGVTRGADGLLAMTAPQTISERRGRFLPHLRPRGDRDKQTLTAALKAVHGSGMKSHLSALRQMFRQT